MLFWASQSGQKFFVNRLTQPSDIAIAFPKSIPKALAFYAWRGVLLSLFNIADEYFDPKLSMSRSSTSHPFTLSWKKTKHFEPYFLLVSKIYACFLLNVAV
jgi:hypothetical protein